MYFSYVLFRWRCSPVSRLQIVNGYFVHFFAPDNLSQIPKNVVFVIDRSGSMTGEKIKQVSQTLRALL